MKIEARVIEAGVDFVERELVTPFVLSTGSISHLTEAIAWVHVETPHGEAVGRGSIYLSDLWAWPDPALSHAFRDAALRRCCVEIARHLPTTLGPQPLHPLELGLRLHDAFCHSVDPPPPTALPVLASAMCLSPFDAAIHDAVGRALGVSAMHLYESEPVATSADAWFDGGHATTAIAAMMRRPARDRFPAWWLVGKNDDLERDVKPALEQYGYRCFKLKLHGRDVAEDVARTAQVCDAATSWGVTPRLSVDTNEACADADFVLDYLKELQSKYPFAFECLDYMEQPTARDIAAHPFDWRAVAALKPVLLDEGLTSLDRMPMAVAQGWSGFALKTCKGHSFALVAAAWAHRHGLAVALQDLTNPGLSAIHAALFAAHVPTINGVELNSPQFTPAANAELTPHWPDLFQVQHGEHRLRDTAPPGLGSAR